jgi:Ca-activated chloride channel family protein
MLFIWPLMLLLLFLVPLFVLRYLMLYRRRQRAIAQFATFGLAQKNITPQTDLRRHIPPVLFLISLIILIIALARPETVVSLPRLQGTVILAFDISGSMAADDLKPTRMEASKAAARSFVERQPQYVEIGVVSFSDNGFAIQVPTTDRDAVQTAINRMAPQRGTSLANGIIAALNTLLMPDALTPSFYSNLTPTPMLTPTPVPKGTYKPGVIVLLTDGENTTQPDPLEAVQAAADQGVRIYTVGIGSAAGADLKIEGFTIHTQLDEPTLKAIAQMTDAAYFNAENEEDLRQIYDNLNPQLMLKAEKTELTAILAGLGILILVIGGVMSLLWFGRVP